MTKPQSKVVRLPIDIYKRLEEHAHGFDTPANVITKIIDHYETADHSGFSGSDLENIKRDDDAFYERETTKLKDTATTEVVTMFKSKIEEMQQKYKVSNDERQAVIDENNDELRAVLEEEVEAVVAVKKAEQWLDVASSIESILSKGDADKEKEAETNAQIKLQSAIDEKIEKQGATTHFISSILAGVAKENTNDNV